MTENNLKENVIGIALDGTGYGEDGNIWGGEFFKADLFGYQRFAHFEYIPMPGGDKAVNSPWRMALSFLANAFINEDDFIDLPFLKDRPTEDIKLILSMIRKGVNSPLTSSAGRVFDAVAALLGICTEACFEAEPPMLLESRIMESVDDYYSFNFEEDVVSFLPTFREIVDDLRSDITPEAIAAKFHNTIARAVVDVAKVIRNCSGLNKVVLAGGTFQNKYLTERAIRILKEEDFEVFTHTLVPCNDGGISLGQLAIAAHK
jgi:hydrogenase maturation protein HypF